VETEWDGENPGNEKLGVVQSTATGALEKAPMTASVPIYDLSIAELSRLDCSPVPKLVHMVLLLALKDRASDVRFDPQPESIRLTYCVDGIVYDMVPPPHWLASAIGQVFRNIAEFEYSDRRIAQSGRVRLIVGDGTAEIVVSLCPTPNGDLVHLTIESNSASAQAKSMLHELRNRPSRTRINFGNH
jgi:type II secretory ATPase GspE/PulE/Tfp pilus assembly ATPase PilB-like protein